MFNRMMLTLAVLVLSVCTAFPQGLAPYVDGAVSVSGSNASSITATSNPNFQVGGGVELNTKQYFLDANAQFDTASLAALTGVFQNTGGYAGTVTGQAYYKIGGKLLVGGGGFWSNQVASGTTIQQVYQSAKVSFNYNQVRPFVGVGYQFSGDRLLATYDLPGLDQVQNLASLAQYVKGLQGALNAVHSQTVTVSNEVSLGKGLGHHFRLTQAVTFSSGDTNLAGFFTGTNLRTSAVSAGVGLKFVL